MRPSDLIVLDCKSAQFAKLSRIGLPIIIDEPKPKHAQLVFASFDFKYSHNVPAERLTLLRV